MNPKQRRFKPIYLLAVPIISVLAILQFNQNADPVGSIMNRPVDVEKISSTEMGRYVYSNQNGAGFVQFEDIPLDTQQIDNIATWINEAPESAITMLDTMPSDISAGIVFKVKSNKEVRIQYNRDKVYVTRTDVNRQMLRYSIEQAELKNFFDEQLKGSYFGEDAVPDVEV
ncbi:hypothetical protein [Saccharibacillus sacchari]|uniref:hypothetical protein n=1 Tax=Saccharibacillus sacchari TaxID=456493 RepID=UPI0004BC6C77|nr:hypothetical protein [Saccharibacillus sacchari]